MSRRRRRYRNRRTQVSAKLLMLQKTIHFLAAPCGRPATFSLGLLNVTPGRISRMPGCGLVFVGPSVPGHTQACLAMPRRGVRQPQGGSALQLLAFASVGPGAQFRGSCSGAAFQPKISVRNSVGGGRLRALHGQHVCKRRMSNCGAFPEGPLSGPGRVSPRLSPRACLPGQTHASHCNEHDLRLFRSTTWCLWRSPKRSTGFSALNTICVTGCLPGRRKSKAGATASR